MATVQEAVRRLTIEATSRGVTETTENMKQLGHAHEGVTGVIQKQERATQSLQSRWNSMQRQYNITWREQQILARVTRDANAAVLQGVATQAEANHLIGLAAARHSAAAAGATAHSRGLAGLNAQMTLTRANAAMMLSSLAPGRFASVGALALTGGPAGALVAVITAATAAAAYFWQTNSDGARTAETTLKEHDRLLGVVKSAYSGAAGEAERFYATSKNIALLQAQQSALKIQGELPGAVRGALSNVGGAQLPLMPGWIGEAMATVGPFEETARRLRETMASGVPDIAAFRDEVGRIGVAAAKSDPQLATLAGRILKATEEAGDMAHKLSQAQAMIRMLEGKGTAADLGVLGITTTNATAERQNEFLRTKRSIERQVEAMKIEAETYGLTTRAAAEYRIVKQLENAAIAAKITLGESERASMMATANAYADATAEVERLRLMKDLVQFGGATFKSFTSDLVQGLSSGEKAWDSFANAGVRALERIGDEATNLPIEAFSKGDEQ